VTKPDDDMPEIRSLDVQIEVTGTPEQVWEAIATGPGISAWFVPSEVQEREGGDITMHIAPDMDSHGIITGWDPPHRFAYEERDWFEDAPPLATEFLVEARAGGTCVVRIVNTMTSTGADWEDEFFDGMDEGWQSALHVLRLYLAHFAGQRCSTIRATGSAAGTRESAYAALTAALGVAGAAEGQRATGAPDAPPLTGVVARVAENSLLLTVDDPAPGVASAFTYGMNDDDAISTVVHLYLFGDDATAVAAREEPAWQAWMRERFPPADAAAR
jgi:uncharacterized protein YndB with AHSA1/START domain